MTKTRTKTLNWKAFTSFNTTLTFIIMSVTGIILYFAPPGRVANWSSWTFWALTKEQWQALHTIFSLLFIIASIFHLYYNWKVFVAYIKIKIVRGIRMKWELAWSIVISLVIFILTMYNLPPFRTIMDWGETLQNSWANEKQEPPIPHAELLTLTELARSISTPLENLMANLNAAGIAPDSTTILVKDLALKYKLTPQELYQKMQAQAQASHTQTGGGYGRKTIAEICQQLDIPLATAIDRLAQENIQASAKDKVRDLASEYNLKPVELLEIIKGQDHPEQE